MPRPRRLKGILFLSTEFGRSCPYSRRRASNGRFPVPRNQFTTITRLRQASFLAFAFINAQTSLALPFAFRRRTQRRKQSPARSPSRPRGLPWPPAQPTMRIKPPSRCLGSCWRRRTGSVFGTAALLLPGRSSSAGPPLSLTTRVNTFPRLSNRSFGG